MKVLHYRPVVVAALSVLLFSPLLCGETTATYELPFTVKPPCNVLLVTVQVNGRPATFLFDSGASVSSVNTKSLHLKVLYRTEQTTAGAFETRHEFVTWVQVDDLDLGGAHFHNIQLPTYKRTGLEEMTGPLDGVLGIDFACRFRTVRVDFEHHKLIFEK